MSRVLRVGGVMLVGVLAVVGAIAPAQAEEVNLSEQIEAVAPRFLSDTIDATAAQSSAETGAVVAVLPSDAERDVAVSTAAGDYAIGLPVTPDSGTVEDHGSLVGIDNRDGTHALASVTDDGAVRVGVLIESDTSPTEYSYAVSAVEGVQLEVLDDGIIIRDARGEFLSYVEPAWAVDADGNGVPTHYEVRGDSIVQIVEHNGAAYPVVADPTSSRFFEKVVIDKTSDPRGAIVRVYTRGGGPNPLLASSVIFDDYKTLVSSAYEGQKYRDQLICHVGNAIGKKPWNLDSWRP
jgi:hypothetical protein